MMVILSVNLYISAIICVETSLSGAPLKPPVSCFKSLLFKLFGLSIVVLLIISPSTLHSFLRSTAAISRLSSGVKSGANFSNNGGRWLLGKLFLVSTRAFNKSVSICLFCRFLRPGVLGL